MSGNAYFRVAVIAASLFTSGTLLAAQQQGFYGQFDLGQASINESLESGGTFFKLDDSASSWRAALGYAWNPWFAVEAAYTDFGSVNATFSDFGVGASADGLELGLVFRWPLSEQFSLSGRTGYLWWDARTRISLLGASDSGGEVFAGIGAEYQVSDRAAVTLGWTRYELDNLDVDQASVGLRWQFGGQD